MSGMVYESHSLLISGQSSEFRVHAMGTFVPAITIVALLLHSSFQACRTALIRLWASRRLDSLNAERSRQR